MDTPHDYNLTSLLQPMTTCMMTCDDEASGDNKKLIWPPYMIHHRNGCVAGWGCHGVV
jgi:hypothetical protein